MQEHDAEQSSTTSANIHITIFPNLDRFMLIDVRDVNKPTVRIVHAKELLTPDYYRELEETFSALLRAEDEAPFQKLILLPARVQSMLQSHGLAALARLSTESEAEAEEAQVSVFLCAGAVLSMSREDLEGAVESFLEGPSYPTGFVEQCKDAFLGLLDEEKGRIAAQEREELRRAVMGQDEQFLTLWQNPGSAPSNN